MDEEKPVTELANPSAGPSPGPDPAQVPPVPIMETKPSTSAPDELFSEAAPDSANPVAQKVNAASAGVFEKFGQFFKRGRGRPRKDGGPKISDLPVVAPPLAGPLAGSAPLAAAPAPPDSNGSRPFDKNLVARCVAAVGKSIAGFFDKKLEAKAIAVTGDREFARQLVRETTVTPEGLQALGEVTDILLKELKVETKHLPLICACAVLAGEGGRYYLAFKSLDARPRPQPQPQPPKA